MKYKVTVVQDPVAGLRRFDVVNNDGNIVDFSYVKAAAMNIAVKMNRDVAKAAAAAAAEKAAIAKAAATPVAAPAKGKGKGK